MTQSPTCPHCNAPIRAEARFCPSCGKPVEPAPAEPESNQPEKMEPVPPEPSQPVKEPVPPAAPSAVPVSSAPKTVRASEYQPAAQPKHAGEQPRILVREGPAERTILLGKTPLSIGRDPSTDVQIGLPTQQNPVGLPDISRHHARISPVEGGYVIEDLGSRNGTYVRGRQIAANTPLPLQNGDIIRIGDIYGNSVSLTYLETKDVTEAAATAFAIDMAMISSQPVTTIGRDPESSIPLSAPIVSWKHAQFIHTEKGHDLEDLGSTNGTFVNGKRIKRVSLKLGDSIQIGPFKMVYGQTAIVAQAASLRLDGVNLRREVNTNQGVKVILNDVSLTILPREFVALVGGSGAGKSTLMDALNGSRRANKGRVLINGDDLYRHYDAYRRDMGYVPQADILHTSLTVKNALTYTAMLRLPPDTRKAEIENRINDVLEIVDMADQKDVQISSLSGGQRKRVSIASEMLSEPRLLFLDEPTSGLDPGLDKKMMRTLNNLADSGCTVLVTTHATSNILDSCDHVIFLAHGQLVYFGPPQKAISYFQVPDFATIYAKVDTKPESKAAAENFKQSEDFHQYVQQRQGEIPNPTGSIPTSQKKKSNGLAASLRQFGILTRRYLDLIFRDKISLFVLCAVMPIIGIFLLLIAEPMAFVGDSEREIWFQLKTNGVYSIAKDAQALINMLAFSAIFLGLFGSAYEVVKERAVYERERMINLGIVPYMMSKVSVLMGFGVIQCLLLLAVVGLKVEYPTRGLLFAPVVEMYLTLLIGMFSAIGLGLLISTLVKNSNTVIYIILVILFVQLIFCGTLFPLPDATNPLSYATSSRWTIEALGTSVDMDRLNNLGEVRIEELNKDVKSQMDFFVGYERTESHLLTSWGILLGFGILSIVLSMVFLKAQDKK